MKKFIAAAVALLLAASAGLRVSAAEASDIRIRMPAVAATVEAEKDLSSLKASDIRASLGSDPLTVDSFAPNDRGVLYLFLLDISGSMPEEHFEAAKAAILGVVSRLRSQDSLELFACGGTVTKVLAGGETAEQAADAVNRLNNDQNTALYDAVGDLTADAAAAGSRSVCAAVISDGGADNASRSYDLGQAEAALKSSGIALNAFCVDTTAEDTGDFKTLVQDSGGSFTLYSAADAAEKISAFAAKQTYVYDLAMTAPNNLADGTEKELKVAFGSLDTLDAKVKPSEWTPDTTVPGVVSVGYDESAGTIAVRFSEPVTGADAASAYSLTTEAGAQLAVASVKVSDDGTQATLTPAEALPTDSTVSLTVSGVKDISMEKNAAAAYTAVVRRADAASASSSSAGQPASFFAGNTGLIAAVCGLLLVLIILLAVFANRRKRVKETAKPDDYAPLKAEAEAETQAAQREKEEAEAAAARAAEKRRAEEAAKAEQARRDEDRRRAEEAAKARAAAAAEEKRKAEAEAAAREAERKKAEEAEKLAEQRRAEEAARAEEQRRAAGETAAREAERKKAEAEAAAKLAEKKKAEAEAAAKAAEAGNKTEKRGLFGGKKKKPQHSGALFIFDDSGNKKDKS